MRYIIILLLVFSLLIFGCKPQTSSCEDLGYIKVDECVSIETVNILTNLTNQVIDIANLCLVEKNISTLDYISYI